MAELEIKTRDQIVDDYKRSFRIRKPSASVRDGSMPHVDAVSIADQLMPLYAIASQRARSQSLDGQSTEQLNATGHDEGVERGSATRSSGYVAIRSSSLGSVVAQGDELIDEVTQTIYRVSSPEHPTDVSNGALVAVESVDVGDGTNRDPGTVLTWRAARPGMLPGATVQENADGSGLSGGGPGQTNPEYITEIRDQRRSRASAENEPAYRRQAFRSAKELGIPLQQIFVYPAVFGPGFVALAYLAKPDKSGGRVMNPAAATELHAAIQGAMSGDSNIFHSTAYEQTTHCSFDITWAAGFGRWADTVPWPPRYPTGGTPGRVEAVGGGTATAFWLRCNGSNYSGVAAPKVGTTFAFFDAANRVWRRKRIATVEPLSHPWFVTCDTVGDASDLEYVPQDGDPVSPWSDLLPAVLPPIFQHFQGMGPQEMFFDLPPDGRRQARWPRPASKAWPIALDQAVALAVAGLNEVDVATLVDGDGATPSFGSPGSLVYVLSLGSLACYKR